MKPHKRKINEDVIIPLQMEEAMVIYNQNAEVVHALFDAIENEDGQNCRWLNISAEDGSIFGEVCEHFDLTGDEDNVKLLVVATAEEE